MKKKSKRERKAIQIRARKASEVTNEIMRALYAGGEILAQSYPVVRYADAIHIIPKVPNGTRFRVEFKIHHVPQNRYKELFRIYLPHQITTKIQVAPHTYVIEPIELLNLFAKFKEEREDQIVYY